MQSLNNETLKDIKRKLGKERYIKFIREIEKEENQILVNRLYLCQMKLRKLTMKV